MILLHETFLGIDYPTLWFLVVGALFSGYAILDGFDLGAGAWHLFLKKEKSRRIALNAVGPVWDGNEVWLVIGGGALFAGFPVLYAQAFSMMYIPFMLFLFFLILRAISIEFRSKEEMAWWRKTWDITYCVASTALAFLLGVVLGNLLKGIPLTPEFEHTGTWLDFLHPYALLTGATTTALFMIHGALYLSLKTEGRLFVKLVVLLRSAIGAFGALFGILTVWSLLYFPHLGDRFKGQPYMFALPAIAFLAIANIPRLVTKRKYFNAFLFSCLSIASLLGIVAFELYPVLLFAPNDPANSITIYNAASSDKTLGIMLLMVCIGGPLVLAYTLFVYKTFRGKVKLDETSY